MQPNLYWFWNQSRDLPSSPSIESLDVSFWLCSFHLSLSLSLSLSGKPESYADYFSLNRTTAELLLLKPIYRELHSRFDLVIKVRSVSPENILGPPLNPLASVCDIGHGPGHGIEISSKKMMIDWKNSAAHVNIIQCEYDTIRQGLLFIKWI